MQTLTHGARAALELELQDAIRDLARLTHERGELFISADVHFALACEPGAAKHKHNMTATKLRLDAFLMSGEIGALELKIKRLNAQLKAQPTTAAPVVLNRDATEGMDDMAGLCEVTA